MLSKQYNKIIVDVYLIVMSKESIMKIKAIKLNKPQIFVLSTLICFIILTTGFQIGTQQYAKSQNYHPLLDQQRITSHIYTPFAIMQWRKQFNKLTPYEFKQALYAPMIASGIAAVIFFITVMMLKTKKAPESHGTARWATDEEFESKDMTKPEGVMLGVMKNGKYIRHNGPEHIICYAPTRCLISSTLVVVKTRGIIQNYFISDIKEGMEVWTGFKWSKVVWCKETIASNQSIDYVNHKALKIWFDAGIEISNHQLSEICTHNHVWPTTKGELRADQLNVGDKLIVSQNHPEYLDNVYPDYYTITKIEEIETNIGFYDISIEDEPHLYMLASGILTHNSGKGVGIIIPSLLSWKHSVLVTDIKAENWAITSGFRQKVFKNKVLKFDPTCTDGTGARFNPLEEIRIKTNHEVKDTQRIVNMIVDPQAKGELDHWGKTAGALLTGLILYVLYTRPNKSLSEVASIINDPNESDIGETLKRMANEMHSDEETLSVIYPGTTDGKHPIIWNSLLECANKPADERGSVISTAVSNLALYRDPIIAANISMSDFKIADLMNYDQPVSLYIVIPPSDLDRVVPLTRIIINQIFTTLTEKMKFVDAKPVADYKHRLLLLIDEFPAFGSLQNLEKALAFIAGYGLKALLIVQSLNQLNKIYTKENSILDNMHVQIAYTPNDNTTAREISDALDTSTIMVTSHSYEKGVLGSVNKSGLSESGRKLMTPGELRVMPFEDELVFVAGINPYKAKKIIYWKDANFTKRLLPPPEYSDKLYNNEEVVSKRGKRRIIENAVKPITEPQELSPVLTNSETPISGQQQQPPSLDPPESYIFEEQEEYEKLLATMPVIDFNDDMEVLEEQETSAWETHTKETLNQLSNATVSNYLDIP